MDKYVDEWKCPNAHRHIVQVVGKGFFDLLKQGSFVTNPTEMKKITLLFSFFISVMMVFAQNNISGRVLSPTNEGIPFAGLVLRLAADSSVLKVEYSDAQGQFAFSVVPQGRYFLEASSLGYQTLAGPVFSFDGLEALRLPDLSLQTNAQQLNTVEVKAQKPLIEVQPDKMVFNVAGSINAMGQNGLELLRKAPGVMLDKDENVILKGKNGVAIYIDGRLSQLQGDDLKSILRGMQASEIEAIEIISQPTARFDAAGNAGIINIRLKKDKKLGTNGSLNYGYAIGIFNKWNGSLSFNNRSKGSNWFGTFSNNLGVNQSFTNFYRLQSNLVFDQKSTSRNENYNNNLKLGADFFLSKNKTLGFILNGNFSDSDGQSWSRTPISTQGTAQVLQVLQAQSLSANNRRNLNANLNYRVNAEQGKEFNIDLDFGRFTRADESFQPNRYFDANEKNVLSSRDFRMNRPTEIGIYSLKMDLSRPLGKGKLLYGTKLSLVETENTFDFFNVISGQNQLDENRSNTFNYRENINAAYASYQQKWKKWGLDAGLRLENTNSLGQLEAQLENPNNRVQRNYVNLFPSGGLTYQAGQSHTWGLNFSRRIDRPNYRTLNPFVSQLDELTYGQGNPFLQPQYTNNIELSHTYKYTLNTSLRVSHTSNFFAEVSDTIEGNRNFLMTRNIASERNIGINISYPFNPAKWWSVYANVNAYRLDYQAAQGNGFYNISANVLSLYVQNTFTLLKNWRFELSGFYTSPSVWGGTYDNRRFWGSEAGVQKRFLNEKFNLKVSVSDLFNSMQWRGISRFGGLLMDASGGWESRQFRVNLSYNFGRKEVGAARRRNTGADEESRRSN
jgi:outer membrane receptor protein involved in Fe transport